MHPSGAALDPSLHPFVPADTYRARKKEGKERNTPRTFNLLPQEKERKGKKERRKQIKKGRKEGAQKKEEEEKTELIRFIVSKDKTDGQRGKRTFDRHRFPFLCLLFSVLKRKNERAEQSRGRQRTFSSLSCHTSLN